MSFFNSGQSTFGASTSTASPAEVKDMEVANPPTDGISSVAWSPQADFLAVGSWSNEVRIYEVDTNTGATNPKAVYSHEQPVLEVCWAKDGTKIFSGGCDKAARMYDVSTGQATQVGAHDAPIRKISWITSSNGSGLLATGGWDKMVKYWDLRQQQPIAQVQVSDRVYAMDAVYPLMVVGTAGRKIHIYNLDNLGVEFKSLDSPLKWQTRTLACFNDAQGYAVGSIEGRVAIQHVEDKNSSANFSFKCHRKEGNSASRLTSTPSQVYSVNEIKFHRQHGTFATCGSDGAVNFWDKDSKTRLKAFDNRGGPITSCDFNRTGIIFAYAVSYDWGQGYTGATPQQPNKIMLHACKDDEIKRRPKK